MAAKIKQLLDDGRLVRVMYCGGLSSPKSVEVVGSLGLVDGIWIDQEHAAVPHADLENLLIACRAAGLDAFARLPPTDYATVMRPYEAGCSGVMAAQIRTVEEAQRVASWSLYPPAGTRGALTATAETQYGKIPVAENIALTNRRRWLAIQIETIEAVECVEEIAKVEGVDLLFLGPGDLSIALGVPGELEHPKFVKAVERTARAAREAKIAWGTLPRTTEYAQVCRKLGCQLFSIHSDMGALIEGMRATDRMFAEVLRE